MITLESFPARTFFSGPKREIKRMLRVLRIKNKQAYWTQRWLLRKFGYFADSTKKERDEKIEKIKKQTEWKKFYNLRSKSFPSGFLGKVKKHLESQNIKFEVNSHRRKLKLHTVKKFPLPIEQRDEQLEALNAALLKQRGILHMATNAGKTLIAAAILKELENQL